MGKLVYINDAGKETVIRDEYTENQMKHDLVFRSDHLAVKCWDKEDVAAQLEWEDRYASSQNVEAVTKRLMQYGDLEEATEAEWEIISNAIREADETGTLRSPKKETATLENLRMYGEKLMQIGIEGDYAKRYILVPPGADFQHLDLHFYMEKTLHRMVNAGASKELICAEMGVVSENDLAEGYDAESMTYVDLGYVYPGAILSAEIVA